jgi:hypothetical protein
MSEFYAGPADSVRAPTNIGLNHAVDLNDVTPKNPLDVNLGKSTNQISIPVDMDLDRGIPTEGSGAFISQIFKYGAALLGGASFTTLALSDKLNGHCQSGELNQGEQRWCEVVAPLGLALMGVVSGGIGAWLGSKGL